MNKSTDKANTHKGKGGAVIETKVRRPPHQQGHHQHSNHESRFDLFAEELVAMEEKRSHNYHRHKNAHHHPDNHRQQRQGASVPGQATVSHRGEPDDGAHRIYKHDYLHDMDDVLAARKATERFQREKERGVDKEYRKELKGNLLAAVGGDGHHHKDNAHTGSKRTAKTHKKGARVKPDGVR